MARSLYEGALLTILCVPLLVYGVMHGGRNAGRFDRILLIVMPTAFVLTMVAFRRYWWPRKIQTALAALRPIMEADYHTIEYGVHRPAGSWCGPMSDLEYFRFVDTARVAATTMAEGQTTSSSSAAAAQQESGYAI